MSTEYLQAAASIATSGALIFTIMTFLRTRKTEQIKLGDKFVPGLLNLRKEMDDVNKLEESPEREFKLEGLDFRTFNTIEWNAFLVNEKEITDQKLIHFYKDIFLDYYKFLPEQRRNDPKSYPEWKKLRENIIRGAYD
jgi:hypothetical protein